MFSQIVVQGVSCKNRDFESSLKTLAVNLGKFENCCQPKNKTLICPWGIYSKLFINPAPLCIVTGGGSWEVSCDSCSSEKHRYRGSELSVLLLLFCFFPYLMMRIRHEQECM